MVDVEILSIVFTLKVRQEWILFPAIKNVTDYIALDFFCLVRDVYSSFWSILIVQTQHSQAPSGFVDRSCLKTVVLGSIWNIYICMFIIWMYQSVMATFSLGSRVMFLKQGVVDNLFSLLRLRLWNKNHQLGKYLFKRTIIFSPAHSWGTE